MLKTAEHFQPDSVHPGQKEIVSGALKTVNRRFVLLHANGMPESTRLFMQTAAQRELVAKMASYFFRPNEEIPVYVSLQKPSALGVLKIPTQKMLRSMLSNMKAYLENPARNSLCKAKASGCIGHLLDFYGKIPLPKMVGKSEYFPLFAVRDLLAEMHEQAQLDLSQGYARHTLAYFSSCSGTINALLENYLANVKSAAKKLKGKKGIGMLLVQKFRHNGVVLQLEKNERPDASMLRSKFGRDIKYYFKGMGNAISALQSALAAYSSMRRMQAQFEQSTAERVISDSFNKIKNNFRIFSQAELKDNPEYYPLLLASQTLAKMERPVANLLSNSIPAADAEKEINSLLGNFSCLGAIYRRHLNAIIQQINALEGEGSFSFDLTDINSQVWRGRKSV